MTQYGFFFDQSWCTVCRACVLACKTWHRLPPGPLKYLRVYEYEKGSFPDVRIYFQWVPCYHCEEPACVSSCPCDAMYRENKYGAVLIDSKKCDGCRLCYEACPYGAPVFEGDEPGVKAQKCDMCIDCLEKGAQPICVLACITRALNFGSTNNLRERYGEIGDLEDLPSSESTKPPVVFKPHAEKHKLVTYNANRTIELMMRRDPLPPLFTSPDDVTEIPEGMVGRKGLVIKHKSAADLMRRIRCDEG